MLRYEPSRCGIMISVFAVERPRVGSIGVYGCLDRETIIDHAYGCIQCRCDEGDIEEGKSFLIGNKVNVEIIFLISLDI